MRIREPGKPEEGFVITWDEVDDAGKCLRAIFDLMDKWTQKKEEEEYIRNDIATASSLFNAFVQEVVDRKKSMQHNKFPGIKNVHFSGPVTVVVWDDGTLTRVRCQDDDFLIDYEKGLAMAIAKKVLGTNNTGSDYYDIFKKWLPKTKEDK
jgi:hypothetical protein